MLVRHLYSRYGLLFSFGAAFLVLIPTTYFLANWRFETGKSLGTECQYATEDSEETVAVDSDAADMPLKNVNLTLENICYTVKASTSDEDLELLRGIDAYFEAGKLTALMGQSGAG
jgi:ABC-type transport system involved in cytochrome bd biosynthesis fused ATPase/permease subunit